MPGALTAAAIERERQKRLRGKALGEPNVGDIEDVLLEEASSILDKELRSTVELADGARLLDRDPPTAIECGDMLVLMMAMGWTEWPDEGTAHRALTAIRYITAMRLQRVQKKRVAAAEFSRNRKVRKQRTERAKRRNEELKQAMQRTET